MARHYMINLSLMHADQTTQNNDFWYNNNFVLIIFSLIIEVLGNRKRCDLSSEVCWTIINAISLLYSVHVGEIT